MSLGQNPAFKAGQLGGQRHLPVGRTSKIYAPESEQGSQEEQSEKGTLGDRRTK